MAEMRASVVVDLVGNLQRRAAKYTQALGSFSQRGQRYLAGLRRSAKALGGGLDRLGNRYTALITGAAGIGTVKFLVGLEQRFVRLGIQAKKSGEEINALKRRIFEVSQAPDVRIDPGQLTSAIETIVEKTGDFDFATDNMRNLALAIQAAGARGQDIGALVSEFKKLGIEGERGVLMALDTLVSQGKAGAFTLQHLAAQGERAVSAFGAMGYQGQEAVQAMGALLQVSRMGTGSAEQAATAYENLLKTIVSKGKELHKVDGITIFDEEQLAKGVEAFRPMPEILKDILTMAEGRATVLEKVFGSEASRSISALATEFKRTGGFEQLDKFMQIQGDGARLMEDSARAAKTSGAALQSLYTAWQKFADANLTKPIQNLADVLNSLDPEQMDKIFKTLGYGAAALGGAIVLRKGFQAGAGAVNMLRGGKGGAGGALAAAMGAGPTPVFVVNWPGSLPGFGGGGAAGTAKRTAGRGARIAGKFKRILPHPNQRNPLPALG